jgi:hypothetical protein
MPKQSKSPKAAGVSGPASAPVGNWLTRALFQPRVLILLALAVSSTVFVPVLVSLLPDLSGRDEYRMQTADIRIVDPPRWIPHDFVRQVVESTALPDEVSLLDGNVNVAIADAFALHPWVADVAAVRQRREPQGVGIDVELRFRRPVAMVEVRRGEAPVLYPIDADGVLLPAADFSISDAKRYPLIRGIRSAPAGSAGMNWGDVHVVGAARLAAELADRYWHEFDLAAITVAQADATNSTIDDLTFELLTSGGSRIIWGRIPGTDHPGELSVEQKLGRLKQYLADFGGFDEPHGPYEIDIRHWQEISRRPLTATRGNRSRR